MAGRPRALHHEHTNDARPHPVLQVRGGIEERCRVRGQVPLARAGLRSPPRRVRDGDEVRNPHDGRMVDALALAAEEGRGHAAKCPGEALAACDPGMSEWGNPPGARPGTQMMSLGGHRGN